MFHLNILQENDGLAILRNAISDAQQRSGTRDAIFALDGIISTVLSKDICLYCLFSFNVDVYLVALIEYV